MTTRLLRARRFAERRHQGQVARDGASPYFDHVAAVARLLEEAGVADNVLCAAYLHDLVERTPTSNEEVGRRFGRAVAGLVDVVTIPREDPQGAPLSWADQRQEALERAADGPDDAVLLKAADLCANVDELVRNHARRGAQAWSAYEAPPASQLAYYAALAEVVARRLDNEVLAEHVATRQRLLASLAAESGALAAAP